jgi:hypothetical protein
MNEIVNVAGKPAFTNLIGSQTISFAVPAANLDGMVSGVGPHLT